MILQNSIALYSCAALENAHHRDTYNQNGNGRNEYDAAFCRNAALWC